MHTAGLCRVWRARSRQCPVTHDVPCSPVLQCDEHGQEASAAAGQVIFVPGRMRAVLALLQDLTLDQELEPLRQQLAADAELSLQRVEPVDAAGYVPDDKQRPPVADNA